MRSVAAEDTEPEALQLLYQAAFESFCVKTIEVVATKLLIHAAVGLEVAADDQQTVCHNNNGAFVASPRSQSLELG
jgi:hypothetical protein